MMGYSSREAEVGGMTMVVSAHTVSDSLVTTRQPFIGAKAVRRRPRPRGATNTILVNGGIRYLLLQHLR